MIFEEGPILFLLHPHYYKPWATESKTFFGKGFMVSNCFGTPYIYTEQNEGISFQIFLLKEELRGFFF